MELLLVLLALVGTNAFEDSYKSVDLSRLAVRLSVEDCVEDPTAAIDDYMNWMDEVTLTYLATNHTKFECPSKTVDKVWMRHILETEKYAKDCSSWLGDSLFIHRHSANDSTYATVGSLDSPMNSSNSLNSESLMALFESTNAADYIKSQRKVRKFGCADEKISWEPNMTLLVREYHRFLNVTEGEKIQDPNFVPGVDIDVLWHFHIAQTQSYYHFSTKNFGRFVHHFVGYDPDMGVDPDLDPMPTDGMFEDTISLYKQVIGEDPEPSLWSSMGTSRSHGHSPHRHNPHGHYPHRYAPLSVVQDEVQKSDDPNGYLGGWYCSVPGSTSLGYAFIFIGTFLSMFSGAFAWRTVEGTCRFDSFSKAKYEFNAFNFQAESSSEDYSSCSSGGKQAYGESGTNNQKLCYDSTCGGTIEGVRSAMAMAQAFSVYGPVLLFTSLVFAGCTCCKCAGSCFGETLRRPVCCLRTAALILLPTVLISTAIAASFFRVFPTHDPSFCTQLVAITDCESVGTGGGFITLCLSLIFSGLGTIMLVWRRPVYKQVVTEAKDLNLDDLPRVAGVTEKTVDHKNNFNYYNNVPEQRTITCPSCKTVLAVPHGITGASVTLQCGNCGATNTFQLTNIPVATVVASAPPAYQPEVVQGQVIDGQADDLNPE